MTNGEVRTVNIDYLHKRRRGFAYALVFLWMLSVVLAFYYLEFSNLRPFKSPEINSRASFSTNDFQNSLKIILKNNGVDVEHRQGPLVVHFEKQGCQCNKFNKPHLQGVIDRYGAQGVSFVSLQQRDSKGPAIFSVREMQTIDDQKQLQTLSSMNTASPSAVVMDKEGHIQYFGPYSSGANCTTDTGAYVENTLDGILSGKPLSVSEVNAFGCFCQWNS